MDPTILSLLDSIPQKSPRSKLETHRELIRQLRRKGCTYRDIVRILHERVGLDVAVSTIHSFIKVRAKHRKQVQYELPPLESESSLSTRMNPNDVASRPGCYFATTVFTGSDCGLALMLKSDGGSATSASGL